ncbi:MAG: protein-export membrane protein SecF [Alphaproteobacteria bacterium RIFCSPLOWO2_01_FULL_40_26]|nr:MAG: protein-export membrane protein SecF [Alphaproteobacteria bacterium RIFCSPHIGHO2_02_FULL_40_34]OFW89051.1 MAG: protein-export membrane protein SecF [Alphaproteobacteria bacterium RIFCSPHIGHO2_01_FULL_40_8]OFW94704.1 MAG: protein-export membrane protein SecF [Alphaproteobacteria bacterium RIFCSPLOWO2_01_FULL_40_26]OFX10176.1 MAG: protein-export membrane protein SecF [Alphaproteobacteria bacterium RIFCSPLOWO2_02_FULL_40_19]OFX11806.1 MAG: protein-export membrane protein SecF [Alphaproteob
MKVHKPALVMSVIFIFASLAIVFVKGLNFGIDFAGGILIEARIEKNFDVAKIRELLTAQIRDVQIQNIDQKDILIRVAKTDEEQSLVIKKIEEILNANFKNIEYRKIDYVGPQVGSELILKGVMALLLSFIFIMIYIWVRFDWQFGLGGIFALLHDTALTLGFYAVTGLEFNLTSIAAILTIIGYSINDSVVIYDRIRENLRRYKKMDLSYIINSSANSTLSRTVLTSGITLISLLALILFGGDVLFSFSMATFFGITVGTYSSIYISAPILLYCDPRNKKNDNL